MSHKRRRWCSMSLSYSWIGSYAGATLPHFATPPSPPSCLFKSCINGLVGISRSAFLTHFELMPRFSLAQHAAPVIGQPARGHLSFRPRVPVPNNRHCSNILAGSSRNRPRIHRLAHTGPQPQWFTQLEESQSKLLKTANAKAQVYKDLLAKVSNRIGGGLC
jgi:hypothetical protein